ncbi:MAG: SIR2 family NAD-dependent protein deacylase [Bacillota bacterium]
MVVAGNPNVSRLADLVCSANHFVVLTGAGVSTESGLPDFRGRGTGLWEEVDPMEVLSADALEYRPDLFYTTGLSLLGAFTEVEPNEAHKALARLEQAGLLKAVITQNIDSLHQKAGSRRVIEVHGHLREATCMECGRKFPFCKLAEKAKAGEVPPRCECGGKMRPDVVLFGDPMPPAFAEAVEEANRSDFMLVIGSSLQVAPAAYLPRLAGRLAIINMEPTPYDWRAEVVIREKAGLTMSQLIQELVERGVI